MRQATTTLTLAAGYNVLLAEDGTPILAEDGSELWGEAFASQVALTLLAPSVTVVTVAPTVTLAMKEST